VGVKDKRGMSIQCSTLLLQNREGMMWKASEMLHMEAEALQDPGGPVEAPWRPCEDRARRGQAGMALK
jgi:hypothetical protein